MQKKIKSFDNIGINYSINRISDFFLIFLHGAGGDLNAWKKEREFFHKAKYSTIAIDLRGHGLSGRPASLEKYRLEYFAQDIYGVIKKEKIKKFILVGHCFGGIVTIMFHKLFPKLSKSYVLVGTTYKGPKLLKAIKPISFFKYIADYVNKNGGITKKYSSHVNFDKFKGSGDWDFQRIYSDIVNTSVKSWLFTYETIADFDGEGILGTINKPVLIIHGGRDSVFPPKIAQKMHKIIKLSTIKIIPDANHIIVLNNDRSLSREILSHVKSLDN